MHKVGSRRAAALLILLPWLAACAGSGASINPVAAAGLQGTQAIEIVALPEPGQPQDAGEQVVAVIRQPDEIGRILAALDSRMQLVPPALCLERYRLRFQRSDGQVITFGYACDAGGVFLRGDQPYWKGMEVHPAQDFQQLVGGYLTD